MTKTQKKYVVYNEAMRYVNNAIEILSEKAKTEGDKYIDKKYIKMAGHTAYTGVLYALDNTHILPPLKGRQRRDVKDYVAALSKENKKMLGHFNECYEYLHLVAGYDGHARVSLVKSVLKDAKQLIQWAALILILYS